VFFYNPLFVYNLPLFFPRFSSSLRMRTRLTSVFCWGGPTPISGGQGHIIIRYVLWTTYRDVHLQNLWFNTWSHIDQYTINVISPPVGLWQKYSLWQMTRVTWSRPYFLICTSIRSSILWNKNKANNLSCPCYYIVTSWLWKYTKVVELYVSLTTF
jgi:hypothetical protein